MLSRRHLLLGASLTSLGFDLPAQAGEIPFTIAEFEAAKKAGKPISRQLVPHLQSANSNSR